MRMEDYFEMLQKAAARNAAHKKDEVGDGHDNNSNSGEEEAEDSARSEFRFRY
jgi:hypothetical protein